VKNIVNNSSIINNANKNILFNVKKVVLIIKNLPSNINNYYNQIENNSQINYINNNQIEPYLETYYYKSDNFLCYYNKFEIISEAMYNKIFKQVHNSLQKNNYAECLFYNQVIMIKLSQYISGINRFILEVGMLNSNNIFCPSFILMYKDEKSFFNHLSFIINKTNNNILSFFITLQFNNGNSLPLYDEKSNEIGMIFNINISGQNCNKINYLNQMNNNFNFNISINNSFNNTNNFNDIIQEFKNPPLIGLQNIGTAHYINATLQCFCHIRKLVNYMKYKPYINDVISKFRNNNRICLTRSFKELVDNLWPSASNISNNQNIHQNKNNKYYSPYNFKDKISEMNPMFQEIQENHLEDLVNFIVMNLHEELNKSPKNQVSNNINQIIDQTNEGMVFKNFITKYNFQAFYFLTFSLEEIRKHIIQN